MMLLSPLELNARYGSREIKIGIGTPRREEGALAAASRGVVSNLMLRGGERRVRQAASKEHLCSHPEVG